MDLSEFGTASTHDGTPRAERQGRLVAAADVALRTTLGTAIGSPQCDGEVAGPRLRHAVRALCDDAHRDGARAEDVLIAVKQAWASLPELTARRDTLRGPDLLRHFISVCIEEFYAAGGPATTAAAARA